MNQRMFHNEIPSLPSEISRAFLPGAGAGPLKHLSYLISISSALTFMIITTGTPYKHTILYIKEISCGDARTVLSLKSVSEDWLVEVAYVPNSKFCIWCGAISCGKRIVYFHPKALPFHYWLEIAYVFSSVKLNRMILNPCFPQGDLQMVELMHEEL